MRRLGLLGESVEASSTIFAEEWWEDLIDWLSCVRIDGGAKQLLDFGVTFALGRV